MSLVFKQTYSPPQGGVAFTPSTAPTPGNLLLMLVNNRTGTEAMGAVTGWTLIADVQTPAGSWNQRRMAMLWRIAAAGSVSWVIPNGAITVTYAEFSGFGSFLGHVTATATNVQNGAQITNTGGPITPASSGPVLIVGGIATAYENDTAGVSGVPYAGVTELDDKNGADNAPGYWSGYIETPGAPSGSYTIGANLTQEGRMDHAGITAAFGAAVPDPCGTIRQSKLGAWTGVAHTVSFDVAPTPGSTLVAFLFIESELPDAFASVDTTGWTHLLTRSSEGSPANGSIRVFTKVAGASEPLGVHTTSNGKSLLLQLFEVSGAEVNVSGSTVGTVSTITGPTLTPNSPGTMLVAAHGSTPTYTGDAVFTPTAPLATRHFLRNPGARGNSWTGSRSTTTGAHTSEVATSGLETQKGTIAVGLVLTCAVLVPPPEPIIQFPYIRGTARVEDD